MEKRDLGNEIKNIVQDAINNGNFKGLNKDIENVVKGAFTEVRKSLNWTSMNNNAQKNQSVKSDNIIKDKKKTNIMKNKNVNPSGQLSGVLFTVFGSIGTAIFGLAILTLTILGYTIGAKTIFHTVGLGLIPFFIISIVSILKGGKIRKRLRRVQRYVVKLNNRSFCKIKELALAVGLSSKATAADLKEMIALGIFPEGHIDDDNTYFMLDNESYEEYLKLQEGLKVKAREKKEKDKIDPEVGGIIEEGRGFVQKIRKANDDIPGEEISRKLDRLEDVTEKIFDYVENHPEKLSEIKKFTEYFLPTTLKLLEGYKKLDHQPIEGQNIANAKREIEDTMDTINLAFENLLDDLFVDIAMDISTDISVLETMFAQEGLTENTLRQRK